MRLNSVRFSASPQQLETEHMVDKKFVFFMVLSAALIGSVFVIQDTIDSHPLGEHRMDLAAIDEGSGLAASHKNANIVWTHNDSGDDARLFAVTPSGQFRGEFFIDGIEAVDWEAITTDLDGHLYIGDIGNNRNKRKDLVVYQVDEPRIPIDGPAISGQLKVKARIPFHYPEQTAFPDRKRMNFDAEALFWAPHPVTGQGTLYVLTKHRSDSETVLYRFDDLGPGPSRGLIRVDQFDVGGDPDNFGGMVTGADATPDGQMLAVLTYHALFVFQRPVEGDRYFSNLVNRIDFDQGMTQQAEAVAWVGTRLVVTNEQGDIFWVDEPKTPRPGVFPKTPL